MAEELPGMLAARKSWDCVQRKDKRAWLDLMAEDIVFEDPIGVSPLDPEGKGHVGKQAISAFWDKNMAPATIGIETHQSYAAGFESAHVMTLTTSFENGARSIVTGIFTYRVNDEGKLTSLRGYWQLADMIFEKPS